VIRIAVEDGTDQVSDFEASATSLVETGIIFS